MKIKYILLMLITLFLFSCGNPILRDLTGISKEENSSSSETPEPPITPDHLDAPVITYESGYLKWDSITDATRYIIYQGASPSVSSMIERSTTTSLQFYIGIDDYGLYYSVCAYNSNSGIYSDYSNFVQISNSCSTTKWTVTFETNGGTIINSYETNIISESPVTTKDGYSFAGWYIDSSFTTQVTFPYTLNEDTVLYAKWNQNTPSEVTTTWTASFTTNGGTIINSYETDVINESPVTTRDGYSFAGWYTDSDFTTPVIFPYTLNEDTIFYAKWNQLFIFNLQVNSYTNNSINLSWELSSSSSYSYSDVSYIYIYIDEFLQEAFHKDSVYGGVWNWSKQNLNLSIGTHTVCLSASGSNWVGKITASNTVNFTIQE